MAARSGLRHNDPVATPEIGPSADHGGHPRPRVLIAEDEALIVESAVPTNGPEIVEWWFDAKAFKDEKNKDWSLDWMPFNHPRKLQFKPYVSHDGEYEIRVDFRIRGSDEASSNTATLKVGADDKTLTERKLGWDNSERIT